jgi:hypothetical protein
MRTIWKSIKRNPIIVVTVLGVFAQAAQQAIDDGKFDVQTVGTYFLQIALGFVAREFTVPLRDHQKEVVKAFNDGVKVPYVDGGEK